MCRLYLQVHNLSDITTGDGLRIDKSTYTGLQNTNTYRLRVASSGYTWQWKLGRVEGRHSLGVFRRAPISYPSYILSAQGMGWRNMQFSLAMVVWWNNDTIYNRVSNTLAWRYTTTHSRRRHMNREYSRILLTSYDISSLQLCTMNRHNTDNRVNFTGIWTRGPVREIRQTDFLTFLRSEYKHEKWIYQNITIVGDLSQLVTALKIVISELFVTAHLISVMAPRSGALTVSVLSREE